MLKPMDQMKYAGTSPYKCLGPMAGLEDLSHTYTYDSLIVNEPPCRGLSLMSKVHYIPNGAAEEQKPQDFESWSELC